MQVGKICSFHGVGEEGLQTRRISRCRTSQYRRSFVPLSVSLWNDLSDPVLMVWDWRVSRAEPMLSCWHDLLFLFCLLLFYLFLLSMGWLCGVWVFGLIECPHSLPALHSGLQNNNNNNILLSPLWCNRVHLSLSQPGTDDLF